MHAVIFLVIGVLIIVFVQAVEDTLTLLVVLLLGWLVFTSWALLFVPKLRALFYSEAELIEQSRSHITQEKSNGFSFASVAAMTAGQVKHFYHALIYAIGAHLWLYG